MGNLQAAIWRRVGKVGGGRTKPRHGPSEIWAWIQHLEGDANQFSSGESSYCLLADRRSDQVRDDRFGAVLTSAVRSFSVVRESRSAFARAVRNGVIGELGES